MSWFGCGLVWMWAGLEVGWLRGGLVWMEVGWFGGEVMWISVIGWRW